MDIKIVPETKVEKDKDFVVSNDLYALITAIQDLTAEIRRLANK